MLNGMTEPLPLYALLHRRGPTAPADGSVFAQPAFQEHVAFLRRRIADGTLVAAGPLDHVDGDVDVDGDGITVLAVESLEEARRLAEQDDQSVAGGLLAVTVRPWNVIMSPGLHRA